MAIYPVGSVIHPLENMGLLPQYTCEKSLTLFILSRYIPFFVSTEEEGSSFEDVEHNEDILTLGLVGKWSRVLEEKLILRGC